MKKRKKCILKFWTHSAMMQCWQELLLFTVTKQKQPLFLPRKKKYTYKFKYFVLER